MNSKIMAYIEKDVETGCYVAIVPGIPGAHTQADTLDELRDRLKEVVELCLEEMDPEESLCMALRFRSSTQIRAYFSDNFFACWK
jgi:predicted RNase H-like HicB family nuclease